MVIMVLCNDTIKLHRSVKTGLIIIIIIHILDLNRYKRRGITGSKDCNSSQLFYCITSFQGMKERKQQKKYAKVGQSLLKK